MTIRHLWRRCVVGLVCFAVSGAYLPFAEAKSSRTKRSRFVASVDEAVAQERNPDPDSEYVERTDSIATFAIGGRQFQLSEKKNSDGMVVEQRLNTHDRMIISVDDNGDGYLDTYEIVTPERTVHLREPRKGRFLFMDIHQKTKRAMLNMKFMLTSKGDYALYAVTADSHKAQHYASGGDFQDLVVGCRETEHELQKLAAEVNMTLAKDSSLLRKNVEKSLLDPSCKAEPYSKDTKAMIDGIMKVALSDKAWDHETRERAMDLQKKGSLEASVKESGSYLTCLRNMRLDTHASRISAAFATYAELPKQNFPWKVKCEKGNDQSTSGRYFNPPDSPPSIFFSKSGQDMLNSAKSAGGDLSDAYARVFFHEMIHYSLISDERITTEIENCCTPPGESRSCDALSKRVANKQYGQQIENQVASALGDKYPKFRQDLRDAFGNGGDRLMDEFYTQAGKAYSKHAENPECKRSNGEPGLNDACIAKFKADMEEVGKKYFSGADSECVEEALKADVRKRDATVMCFAMASIGAEMLGVVDPKSEDYRFGQFCSKRKKSAGLFDFIVEKAWADESFINNMCSLSGTSGRIDLAQMDYTPRNVLNRSRYGTTDQRDDTAGKIGDNTNVTPTSGGQTTYKSDKTGPRTPDYGSASASERESKILADLKRQDSYFNRPVASLSDRLLKPLVIQEARAESNRSGGGGSSSGGGASSSSYSRSEAAKLERIQAKVPLVTVPSPVSFPSIESTGLRMASASAQRSNTSYRSPSSGSAIDGPRVDRKQKEINTAGGGGVVAGKAASTAGAGIGGLSAGAKAGEKDEANKTNEDPACVADPSKTPTVADERALKALLNYFQRPYDEVKPELARPSVICSLKRHLVQVIDDEGQVHGAGYPRKCLLHYRDDDGKDRLKSTNCAKDAVR